MDYPEVKAQPRIVLPYYDPSGHNVGWQFSLCRGSRGGMFREHGADFEVTIVLSKQHYQVPNPIFAESTPDFQHPVPEWGWVPVQEDDGTISYVKLQKPEGGNALSLEGVDTDIKDVPLAEIAKQSTTIISDRARDNYGALYDEVVYPLGDTPKAASGPLYINQHMLGYVHTFDNDDLKYIEVEAISIYLGLYETHLAYLANLAYKQEYKQPVRIAPLYRESPIRNWR